MPLPTPGQQHLAELDQKIATSHSHVVIGTAEFLWDAIAGAGTAGQSTLALLKLIRGTWPDMRQGEAIDYLTRWIEHARTVGAIHPHPQPPAGTGLDWYVSPVNHIKAGPRIALVQVATPISLNNLAAALNQACQENTRRGGLFGELTNECMEFGDGVVIIYNQPRKTS